MPTQRKVKCHELNPVEQAYLIGRHDAGKSFDKISHETGVLKTTIVNTFQNAKNRGSAISLSCARPCKTDLQDNRILCREVRKGPKARRIPLAAIQANNQLYLSRSTIKHHLKEKNIQK